MEQVIEIYSNYIEFIVLGLVAITFIFFILLIILFRKNSKLQRQYNGFMRGSQTDIEGLIHRCLDETDKVKETHQEIKESIKSTQLQLKQCVQKVGVVRYSAVPGAGADLSFVIALLNEEDDGLVINGIYTRDGSYTYGKPIIKGESKYLLSDEEIEAIKKSQDIK